MAVAVLALLPLAGARSAAAATIAGTAKGVAIAIGGMAKGVAIAVLARWRVVAGALATAAAIATVWLATERSEAVAARADARATHARTAASAPALPAAPPEDDDVARTIAALRPQLAASPYADQRVVKNLVVASPDPVETCARATHGLVRAIFPLEGDDDLEAIGDVLGRRVGQTCAAWPAGFELYAICEATPADLLDGNVSCYPYDPFVVTTCTSNTP